MKIHGSGHPSGLWGKRLPTVGTDTNDILADAGYTAGEIADFKARGVVGARIG